MRSKIIIYGGSSLISKHLFAEFYKDNYEFIVFCRNKEKTIQNIAESIIKIRSSKLPDPKIIGNCGSFFKNPIILKSKLKDLKKTFKEVPFYPHTKDKIKIPAAWIIEKLGFKGYNENNVGVYKNHSLVLINHGNARGKDVKILAEKIRSKVFDSFSISLEYEVNVF